MKNENSMKDYVILSKSVYDAVINYIASDSYAKIAKFIAEVMQDEQTNAVSLEVGLKGPIDPPESLDELNTEKAED